MVPDGGPLKHERYPQGPGTCLVSPEYRVWMDGIRTRCRKLRTEESSSSQLLGGNIRRLVHVWYGRQVKAGYKWIPGSCPPRSRGIQITGRWEAGEISTSFRRYSVVGTHELSGAIPPAGPRSESSSSPLRGESQEGWRSRQSCRSSVTGAEDFLPFRPLLSQEFGSFALQGLPCAICSFSSEPSIEGVPPKGNSRDFFAGRLRTRMDDNINLVTF